LSSNRDSLASLLEDELEMYLDGDDPRHHSTPLDEPGDDENRLPWLDLMDFLSRIVQFRREFLYIGIKQRELHLAGKATFQFLFVVLHILLLMWYYCANGYDWWIPTEF
jgi:hypothetical protein